ncbi:MAG TPA: glutamine--tRNA ligase/YqeY domain fusion protein [Gammaproteobacteria bacterium]|nr:glutamine--tRNA ligase/YqeY domain fusion protein [Gammaproteobacteria bacterium]
METSDPNSTEAGRDFIRQFVAEDVAAGKNGGRVQTRFPPEPNGYLHIGHAMAICVDFGVAQDFGGTCYLRFDDTNPERETEEFVESIKRDVHWLGFDWGDQLAHASDYFQQIHDFAVELIERGLAYVDHQSADDIRRNRGTLTEPGKDSPYRDRSVEENLRLFESMRRGELEEGSCVLRAKIDMAAPNINLRDPTLYRIRKVAHQRTGDTWCIYPMYDYAHTLSDAIEGTTHSLCSLEFEDHRPLYDWFLDQLWKKPTRPRQIEFSRLNLMFTVMSKRILKRLVDEQHVEGWDDPRMPTLSGIRRRGYTPEAIRTFVQRVGVTKKSKVAELGQFETCIRDDLNERAQRRFAVLDPLKIVIDTYPEDKEEWVDAANHPNKPELGSRKVPFTREIYIEREDFMENAPGKFHRLKPGGEVRLRYAYIVKCERVVKNAAGDVVEVHCSHDAASRSGSEDSGRKVKGTIHWVSAKHAFRTSVRLYDRLFSKPFPGEDLASELNPQSLTFAANAALEPALQDAKPEERFQFERVGYFVADSKLSQPGAPVFNRTVTLRDSWAKIEQEALAAAQK